MERLLHEFLWMRTRYYRNVCKTTTWPWLSGKREEASFTTLIMKGLKISIKLKPTSNFNVKKKKMQKKVEVYKRPNSRPLWSVSSHRYFTLTEPSLCIAPPLTPLLSSSFHSGTTAPPEGQTQVRMVGRSGQTRCQAQGPGARAGKISWLGSSYSVRGVRGVVSREREHRFLRTARENERMDEARLWRTWLIPWRVSLSAVVVSLPVPIVEREILAWLHTSKRSSSHIQLTTERYTSITWAQFHTQSVCRINYRVANNPRRGNV